MSKTQLTWQDSNPRHLGYGANARPLSYNLCPKGSLNANQGQFPKVQIFVAPGSGFTSVYMRSTLDERVVLRGHIWLRP